MLALAKAVEADGLRVRGAIQDNAGDASCPAMSLVDLATGERYGISQQLGTHARGCRLDPGGLAVFAARLDAAIQDGCDLIILNKFGKAEAEGGGLRAALARAIDSGIPVLTAVRSPYSEAWLDFHGGLAADLAPSRAAALAWCRGVHNSSEARYRRWLANRSDGRETSDRGEAVRVLGNGYDLSA
jgi:hypothetical protein